LRKYIIHCLNVPFINVADARIYPDSGKVTLYKNAVNGYIKNASITANIVTKYHNIRNVKANIFSKHDYFGRGDYLYVDENEKKFMIHFTSIQPDTTGQTVSQGVISERIILILMIILVLQGKLRSLQQMNFKFRWRYQNCTCM